MNTFETIITAFDFLIADFGFKLIDTRQDKKLSGEYLFIYRNDLSKVQLEISADEHWFHCHIRRIINNEPAKYSDKKNSVGFEVLARLETNNNYDHFDYVVTGKGLSKILENAASLLKRHKDSLITENWIDVEKIEQLQDEEIEKKFGFKPDRNKPTYFGELKKQAAEFLKEHNFEIILDSDELPPYDRNSLTRALIFKNSTTSITISAEDWRDAYYIYHIKINNRKTFEIDLSKHKDIVTAVGLTMQKLKELI